MLNDPFKILNVSPNSTLDEIKKAFRTLIMRLHPDLTGDEEGGQKASLVIEAYKSAEKITVEREGELKREFNRGFQQRFGQTFKEPLDSIDFLLYWELIISRLDELFFSTSGSTFYLAFAIRLLEALQERGVKGEEGGGVHALFSSLLYICRARGAGSDRVDGDDYAADRVREEIVGYFKAILSASDYLSFRYNLNSPKDELLKTVYLKHGKVKSKGVREELFASLLLIFIASDEQFAELWWASREAKGSGGRRLLAE